MSELHVYPVTKKLEQSSFLDKATYEEWYRQSIESPEAFWSKQAQEFLSFDREWDSVREFDFKSGNIQWFKGAKLNVSYNCIDRHLETAAQKTALIWEGDNPEESKQVTYRQLHTQVCKFANVLKKMGVRKGDRVCIYMPMILEASYAMLACTRIGAIHSVVFGGFSPEALKDRILDSDCKVVITADEGVRGGRTVALKTNVDRAVSGCPNVSNVLVVKRTGAEISWNESLDVWLHDIIGEVNADCPPEQMDAEDPLFILYTSGSTGKPKGVLHTTGGYLLQAAMTHKYVLDCRDNEVYWCTADVGWITGHTYILYGPLANCATSLMFEGVPNYPTPGRHWEVVDKHHVAIYYTAPTVIRALMAQGDSHVTNTTRQSLRVLGTVGEPINPEAWEWYHRVVGESRCPIVDTWWQTETGAHLISPLPGAMDLKPGSASLPFFGVEPAILDDKGKEIEGVGEGSLVMKSSWPSQIRGVYGNHQRLLETYFAPYPGYYFTGDGARRDEDGYYWITGRVDDVLNVSGHRMGTAEIESSLVLHPAVAEAAVVGYPHNIKGQGIYAYVTLMLGFEPSEELRKELVSLCASEIGPIAKPDIIQWSPGLPKTRSGKIMRRILRKIAADEFESLGDISTLADPSVVDQIIEVHKATTT